VFFWVWHFSSPPPRTPPSLLGGHGSGGGIAGGAGGAVSGGPGFRGFMACSAPNSTLAIYGGTDYSRGRLPDLRAPGSAIVINIEQ
jgi:hypothetical protein